MTETDVALAHALFPILVEVAKRRETITYGELLREARELRPDDAVLARAKPRFPGRRLDAIRELTAKDGTPDLTSLVVNQATGEVGDAYSDAFDPASRRREVYEFDWSTVGMETVSLTASASRGTRKTGSTVTRDAAKARMAMFAKANASILVPNVSCLRERIISAIVGGADDRSAFESVGAIRGVGTVETS